MLAVTRFKAKKAASTVPAAYPGPRRVASGCWKGTKKRQMTNTLVVVHRHQAGQSIAAGWFTRTLKSRPYWRPVTGGAYHVSDPSICK